MRKVMIRIIYSRWALNNDNRKKPEEISVLNYKDLGNMDLYGREFIYE